MDIGDMGPFERAQFEEVIHKVPLELEVVALDTDAALEVARSVCEQLVNPALEDARTMGVFNNVPFEPIRMTVKR